MTLNRNAASADLFEKHQSPIEDNHITAILALNEKCEKSKLKPKLKKLRKKSFVEQNNNILIKLIQAKIPELRNAGLSNQTVLLSRNSISPFLERKKRSKKTITKLFAGAIYSKANFPTTIGLRKHQGEGITEQKVEHIFGITRKTIRKWARLAR